ncbi:unnamed protein product [Euphydryas editha]|uniref:Tc1-like transposase DDE domain-containing protein n=1 Tax=Euphydryas editha TaxID=104508 RepID=A0AAU9U2W4_EUPED|nr:unnamed protein product [Euphydryas editha]
MWFQQDGCPAHYARAVRDYLNEEYPDRRIGSSELRQKIDAASEEINARNFARLVKRSFVRRCRACIRAAGKQFEHLL